MPIFQVIEPKAGKLRHRLFIQQLARILGLLLAVTMSCAAGLYVLDETPGAPATKVFTAIWNAANTISTLGDLTNLTLLQEAFLILAMFSLMVIGGYAITSLTGILSSPDLLAFRENRKVARMLDHLKDHIIIVGYSKVGQLLADRIKGEGGKVLIIDRDPAVATDASSRGFLVLEGAADDEATLQRAEIAQARAILLTVEDTTRRLSVTLMARALNPNIYLLSIGLTEPGRNWLIHAGASEVVMVDRIIADTLHERLIQKLKHA